MTQKDYHYNPNSRRRISLQEKLKRGEEMYNLHTNQHLTLQKIGEMNSLTRERVRQIIEWYKEYKKIEPENNNNDTDKQESNQ